LLEGIRRDLRQLPILEVPEIIENSEFVRIDQLVDGIFHVFTLLRSKSLSEL
jgi:hypothetical protein